MSEFRSADFREHCEHYKPAVKTSVGVITKAVSNALSKTGSKHVSRSYTGMLGTVLVAGLAMSLPFGAVAQQTGTGTHRRDKPAPRKQQFLFR